MFDEIAEPLCSVVPAFFICQYHYDDSGNCNRSVCQNVEVSFEWNIHLLTTGRFIKYLLVSLRKWLLSGRICTASRFHMLCIQRCYSAQLFCDNLSCSCLLIFTPATLLIPSTGLFWGRPGSTQTRGGCPLKVCLWNTHDVAQQLQPCHRLTKISFLPHSGAALNINNINLNA